MEVRVGAGDLHRLVPAGGLRPKFRSPVELHERRLVLVVDETEGVDPETLHHPQRSRDRPVRHRPHDHVGRLRHQADEVPEGVVGAGRLRIAPVGLHLHRVDKVGKLDRVLDEEDRDVVAHQVPVALARVEFDRETAHVAGRVHRARAAGDGGEAGEELGALADLRKDVGPGVFRQRPGEFEIAVRRRASGMDDPLGDPLMVEMLDLLAQDEVFQQRGSTRARLQGILVIAERNPEVGGQALLRIGGGLVKLTPIPGLSRDRLSLRRRFGGFARRRRRWAGLFHRIFPSRGELCPGSTRRGGIGDAENRARRGVAFWAAKRGLAA